MTLAEYGKGDPAGPGGQGALAGPRGACPLGSGASRSRYSARLIRVLPQKFVDTRRRPGQGALPAEPWLLRDPGAEDLDLVAPHETPPRVATQRVPQGGPPAPAGALSSDL